MEPHQSLAPISTGSADDFTRSSTDTLRSLDISQNIPIIILPMDAEDSPWGGRRLLSREQIAYHTDIKQS